MRQRQGEVRGVGWGGEGLDVGITELFPFPRLQEPGTPQGGNAVAELKA